MKIRLTVCLSILIVSFSGCKNLKRDPKQLSDREKTNQTSLLIEAVKDKNIGNFQDAISKLNQLITRNPNSDVAYYQLSLVWQLLDKLPQAKESAKKAYELNPKNQWYKVNLAVIHDELKEYLPASKLREELVTEFPENTDYYYDLVVDYIYTDQWENAINTYTKIEKQTGISEEISLAKHRLWIHIKKPLNAANEIQQLINAFPSENKYPLMLGDLYLTNKMFEKAKIQFDKSLTMNNLNTYMSLAEYYRSIGNYDSTNLFLSKAFSEPSISIDLKVPVLISYFEISEKNPELKKEAYSLLDSIIKAHPQDPKGWSMYADFLTRDKRFSEAKHAYIEVLNSDQSKYVFWEELLKIFATEQNFDSVIIYSNKAIELFPSQPFLFYVKGLSLYMNKNYNEAIQTFETGKSLVLEPNSMLLEMYIYMGESYHSLKNDARSDAAFDKVLELDSKNAYVLNNYSYYLALRNADLDKAVSMSKELVRLNPNQSNYLDTYAWALFKKGDYTTALVNIEKAIDLGSNSSAVIIEHYGDILWKNNQTSQAIEAWQKALIINPNSESLKQKVSKKSYFE